MNTLLMTLPTVKPAIAVQDVSHSFAGADGGRLCVLQNVSFLIPKGQFVCLLGTSGCGKSTLLNLLSGFIQPTLGEVRVEGRPISRPRRTNICVSQDCSVFPWLTVEQNIGFGLQDLSSNEREAEIERTIGLVRLNGFENAYPHQLSGGMRQRVELARALVVKPSLIFMDEPFGALDSMTREKLRNDLLAIWQQERNTIVFVTHDLDEALLLADRILVLSRRPATICADIELSSARLRQSNSYDLLETRKRLYELLHCDE